MGYTSHVKAMVYGTEEALASYRALEKLKDNNVFKHFGNEVLKNLVITFRPDTPKVHALCLELPCCKWYPHYTDVKAWDDFMNESVEHGLNMEFCRIGEETGDIEILQNGDELQYFLNVCTTIELDVPESTEEVII
jgi:hypothetical protein